MIERWEITVWWFTEDGDGVKKYKVLGNDPLQALARLFDKHPTGSGVRTCYGEVVPMATRVNIQKLWEDVEEIE